MSVSTRGASHAARSPAAPGESSGAGAAAFVPSPLASPTAPGPMADAFVYQTAWRATVLTAAVVVVGLLAAVAVAALRRRRTRRRAGSKPMTVPSPKVPTN